MHIFNQELSCKLSLPTSTGLNEQIVFGRSLDTLSLNLCRQSAPELAIRHRFRHEDIARHAFCTLVAALLQKGEWGHVPVSKQKLTNRLVLLWITAVHLNDENVDGNTPIKSLEDRQFPSLHIQVKQVNMIE